MTTQETREYLESIRKQKGFILESDVLMMEADPEWQKTWHVFVHATYSSQRRLDRKTVELLQVVANTAMRAGVKTIEAHVKLALKVGATPEELMEACENVVLITGSNAFHEFQAAYANVIGPPMEIGKEWDGS